MIRLLIALAVPLFAVLPLRAADLPDDWYEIELIVFEHKTSPGRSAEVWTPEPAGPDVDQAVELAPPREETPQALSALLPAADIRVPYQRLDAGEMRLERLYNRLTVSGEYTPLLHLAWRQPANPDQPVRGVRVRSEADKSDATLTLPPSALFIDTRSVRAPAPRAATVDGVVALQRSRFLHLSLDLQFTEPAADTGESGLFSIFTRRDDRAEVFRLQGQRRIRVNEVHYFDHPVIGVIVQVRPQALQE